LETIVCAAAVDKPKQNVASDTRSVFTIRSFLSFEKVGWKEGSLAVASYG